MSPILRTFVLATIAVPVVIYGLMPQLHKIGFDCLPNARTRKTRRRKLPT
jgi:hypothetical protein